MSNFDNVRGWMEKVGQATPSTPIIPNKATLDLRNTLIQEEATEASDEIKALLTKSKDTSPLELVLLLKELADTLVVTYGTFAALGVNADEVMKRVMQGNDSKIACGEFRDDGKLIVPAKDKQKIKECVESNIRSILLRAGVPVPEEPAPEFKRPRKRRPKKPLID